MALNVRSRIVSVPDSCGGTLTAASITGLTPDRFEAMASTEYALARTIAEAEEARAVGITPRPLQELLMSRIKEIDKKELMERKVKTQSLILPYTYRRRRTNEAADYFKISAGAANPAAGTTVGGLVYPASSWDITVAVSDSPYATALTGIERYFIPGQWLFVENLNSAGAAGSKTAYTTAYKIIKSANVSSTTAKITIVPNYTDTGWAALSSPQKLVMQPTFGVVQIGTNNVDDRESWCTNEPTNNLNSLLVDWHQTSRYTQCHNDEYDRILKAILNGETNDFQKEFQFLPLAEQNRKQRLAYEKKWMNSVFYGQALNELQTAETYAQLPTVVDPEDGTVYGYKANALGIRTLLATEASGTRVVDMGGGALSLDLLFQLAYDLKRNREVAGDTIEVVDFMTDKDTANMIDVVLLDYLKKMFAYSQTQFFKQGEIRDGANGLVRFKYKQYDIPTIGIQIAIFVDQYFTDRATNFTGANVTRGNSLWAIDWSDFDIGIIGTNSAKREYKGETMANVNPLFSCVITPNTKHYELRSTTWTVRVGDAKRHLVVENYSLTTNPTLTLPTYALAA